MNLLHTDVSPAPSPSLALSLKVNKVLKKKISGLIKHLE